MSFKGRIFTQEHRDKLSKSHIGNTNAKGHTLSKEIREQFSKDRKGKPGKTKGMHWKLSKECCEKNRLRLMGHKTSDETRRKIGLAHIGNKWALGRKATDETIWQKN